MKKCFQLLAGLAAIVTLTPGCTHKSNQACGLCPAAPPAVPYIYFKVMSKTTGNNLFYGSPAQYKTTQLAMHHIVNGKIDTVSFFADTTRQGFEVIVAPVHASDTVTMNIASLPQDTFIFHTGTTETCCPSLVINYVTWDGTIVYHQEDGNKVVVLQK
jgi:hypothetical protein